MRRLDRILVTGGAGFIGSNFVHYLLEALPHAEVFNLDALTYAGAEENLDGVPDSERHHLIVGDIVDRQRVTRLLVDERIDTIVHLAAESHVDRSILGPREFVTTNVLGTFELLEAARQVWLEQERLPLDSVLFHHVSTDEVYGDLTADAPAFSEDTPVRPNSPYAATKAGSDHIARSYQHTYGLPLTLSNCSNNYGPRQFPEKLIPLVIENALEGKPLPLYGDGKQIRDWLYVADHCQAIHRILEDGVIGETYNIGGGVQITNVELVKKICAILDAALPESPNTPHAELIEFVPDRPGHDRRYAIDSSKIARELGWVASETLATGLQKTVDWYLSNREWVEAIKSRGGYREWIERNYSQRGVQ